MNIETSNKSKMAANVQVKPKIKQEEFSEDDSAKSSPKSPKSKPCSDCRTTTPKHLIETYVVATADGTNLPTATRKDLCGACLVGHDVAVFRASGGGWCFGEVKAYDISKLQQPFLISFLDGDEEWNDVSTMASSDYLNYIRMNDLPQGIVASFDVSSSSFSEMSSFDFSDGAVKPLFDESKLIHLDRTDSWSSFESFEENIFPDYGGNIEVMLTAMASAVNKPSSTTPTTYTPKKLPLEDNKVKTKRRRGRKPTPTNKNTKKSPPKTSPRQIRAPVMWTPDEDRNLQRVVEEFQRNGMSPFKWHEIASHIRNRNGKQCRERYINHLSSTLKKETWSPEEDDVLFRSFFRLGNKWSQVSKMLRGRTDNGTKNRFHHLRRRLNKDVHRKLQKYSKLTPKADNDDDKSSVASAATNTDPDAIECNTRKILNALAVESKNKSTYSFIKGYSFGPYMAVTEDQARIQCKRCGLFIGSEQTGVKWCTRTKWCEACTLTPPYVAHDLLRECLELRREEVKSEN